MTQPLWRARNYVRLLGIVLFPICIAMTSAEARSNAQVLRDSVQIFDRVSIARDAAIDLADFPDDSAVVQHVLGKYPPSYPVKFEVLSREQNPKRNHRIYFRQIINAIPLFETSLLIFDSHRDGSLINGTIITTDPQKALPSVIDREHALGLISQALKSTVDVDLRIVTVNREDHQYEELDDHLAPVYQFEISVVESKTLTRADHEFKRYLVRVNAFDGTVTLNERKASLIH